MAEHYGNEAPNDRLAEQSSPSADPSPDRENQPDVSTARDMADEFDTLVALLREPAHSDSFSQESACRRAVEAIRQMGRTASPSDLDPAVSTDGQTPALRALGQYQLIEKLGEGGMGAVYRALHTRLEKVVAVKVMSAGRVDDPEAIARFDREMRAVGRLNHPNIVGAFDAGEVDGSHYLVMELVDGQDLGAIVRRTGPLPVADACEAIRQAAVGLDHAHSHGLVHRDVKPSNLMVTRQGEVKLLDLGLARLAEQLPGGVELTSTGQMMGTFDYMAPEQGSDSHAVDHRADVYALGATLYKLLAGRAPFAGPQYGTPMKRMMALATEDPEPIRQIRPDVPKDLARVIHRMLARDPDRRPATGRETADLLAPFAAGSDLASLVARADEAAPKPSVEPGTASTQPAAASAMEHTPHTIQISPPAAFRPRAGGLSRLARWFGNLPPAARFGLTAAAGAAAIVVLATFFTLRTPKGMIVVEVPDGEENNIAVDVLHGGKQVQIMDADHGWTVRVAEGTYQIDVTKGDDRFVIRDNVLTVSRDKKSRVRVFVKQPPAAERSGGDVDRSSPPETVDASPRRDCGLIPAIDAIRDVRRGFWRVDGDELVGEKGTCLLPVAIDGEYKLSGEMTLESTEGAFGVLLPVGLGRVAITMAHDGSVKMFAVAGCEHQISEGGDNLLREGQRYKFEAIVRRDANDVRIAVLLDGISRCVWEGDHRLLGSPVRDVFRPAVLTNGAARFHRLDVEKHSGTLTLLGRDRVVVVPFEKGPAEMGGGPVSYDLAPEGWVLVGLRVRDHVQSIQPIYRKGAKHMTAAVCYPGGGSAALRDFDVAKPGYAVGGFRCSFNWRQTTILRIIYMKDLGNGRLDPHDTYESDSIGINASGEPYHTILSDGRPIVGLQTECHGPWQGFGLQGLGLLYAQDSPEVSDPQVDSSNDDCMKTTPNLIPLIDFAQDSKSGTWGFHETDLMGFNGACLLPVAVDENYILSGQMTWESDEGAFELVMPVGMRRVAVRMSHDGAVTMKCVRGGEKSIREEGNPLLKSGQLHEFEALVERDGSEYRLAVAVDGKTQCVWRGCNSELTGVGDDVFRPALQVQGSARFHGVHVQKHVGEIVLLDTPRDDYMPFEIAPSAHVSKSRPMFFDTGPEGSVLVGLRISTLCNHKLVRFAQPLYRSGDKYLPSSIVSPWRGASLIGPEVAKDGYAVGGIRCNAGRFGAATWWQLIYMKDLGNGQLDPNDTYDSPRIGDSLEGDPVLEMTSAGRAIVGLYGDVFQDGFAGVGFLHAKDPTTAAGERFPEDGSVEEQKAWVVAELKRLNPGFDGRVRFEVEGSSVTAFDVTDAAKLQYIRPVGRLKALRDIALIRTKVSDLSPLRGLQLRSVDLEGSPISDLTPLLEMPLETLIVRETKIADLQGLERLSLRHFNCQGIGIEDLSPLRDMELESLNCGHNPISDISVLANMPLKNLILVGTKVDDLTPLGHLKLESLEIRDTRVTELAPLRGVPLLSITCDFQPKDAMALRQIKTLKTINGRPTADVFPPEIPLQGGGRVSLKSMQLVDNVGEITAFAFGPEGQWIVTGTNGGSVQLHRVGGTGESVLIVDENEAIRRVAVSRDGKLLAWTTHNGKFRLWDLHAKKARLSEDSGRSGVAFSPTEDVLAVGDVRTGSIALLATEHGERIRTLSPNKAPGFPASICFSRDGKRLVSGHDWQCTLLWQVDQEKSAARVEETRRYGGPVDFAPDGRTAIALGEGDQVLTLDVKTGDRKLAIHHGCDRVYSADFSPCGEYLLTCGSDSFLRAWDANSGTDIACAYGERFASILFSPDGQLLATTGQHSIELWEVVKSGPGTSPLPSRAAVEEQKAAMIAGQDAIPHGPFDVQAVLAKTFAHKDAAVAAVAFLPDGRNVLTAGEDGKVRVWDMEHARTLETFESGLESVRTMACTPDGSLIAVAGDAGPIVLLDRKSGKAIHRLNGHEGGTAAMAFTPDGTILITGDREDENLHLWDAVNGNRVVSLPGHTGGVKGLAVTSNGERLISCGADGHIQFWDLETRQQQEAVATGEPITCVAFALGDKRPAFATAHASGKVAVRDAETGEARFSFESESPIRALAYTRCGRLLAAACDDGYLRLWHAHDGREALAFQAHDGAVLCAAYSRDADLWLTGGADRTAKAWRMAYEPKTAADDVETWVRSELKWLNPQMTNPVKFGRRDGTTVSIETDDGHLNDASPLRILSDLESFTHGGNRGMGISDLSPLQGLPVSTIRLIGVRGFSDLSMLAGLPLKDLYMWQTPVTDLSPLKGLPIERLALMHMSITDLSVLHELPLKSLNIHYFFNGNKGGDVYLEQVKGLKLEHLECSLMPVTNLDPIEGMPLISLNIVRTNVTDLSVLRGMPLKRLRMFETDIPDLSPLQDVPLEELWAPIRNMRDIEILRAIPTLEQINGQPAGDPLRKAEEQLQELQALLGPEATELYPTPGIGTVQAKWITTELKRANPGFDGKTRFGFRDGDVYFVDFDGKNIDNLRPLQPLRHLNTLHCNGSAVTDLTPLAGKRLEIVTLRGSKVLDLAPLRGGHLRQLDLSESPVRDLSPLIGIPIEVLRLRNVQGVTDFRPLKLMPLKELNVGGTKFDDSTLLEGMPLERLDIQGTAVKDLSPLHSAKLTRLALNGTAVSDLSPLAGMPLRELQCEGAPVKDFAPLLDTELKSITCHLTLDAVAILRQIKTLKTVNDRPAEEALLEAEVKLEQAANEPEEPGAVDPAN